METRIFSRFRKYTIFAEETTNFCYKIEWAEKNDFFYILGKYDGVILKGVGGGKDWFFRLMFEGHEGLSNFYQDCVENEIDIEIESVVNAGRYEADGSSVNLTSDQRDILVTAINKGYFETPRKVGLDDLSEEYDITPQTASQKIRAAVKKILNMSLAKDL
ncbi:MAG: helix-turn-helix domain-containing protein [Halobacteria archaeon]